MIKQAYYKGLIKVAQGIPAYDPTKHDLPRQWFTDRGYTQAQYNEYKDVGSTLDPVDRQQHIHDMIDMDRKAAQVPKTTTTRRQGNTVTTTTAGSGTFRHGKLVQPGGTQPGASVPTQAPKTSTTTARSQLARRRIEDMKRKAEQLRKAYKEQYGDDVPEVVGGLFNGDGQLEQLDVVEPNAPAPVQPSWHEQAQQQPTQQIGVRNQIPAQQPVYTRNKQIRKAVPAQAPAASPDTQISHNGYTWQAFSNGAAARKYYGGNVIGTKINGQTYYRPFDATSSTSTRNASRPGRRVVVPAYRRVL